MRVLIVSHNPVSEVNNMGRTIRSYFGNFRIDETAQFYIRPEIPSDDSICQNYFRFTDKDAIRSVFSFKHRGCVFGKDDICPLRGSNEMGALAPIYRFGRKRTVLAYILRNLLWGLGRWETGKLWNWVDTFDPDVIFFASGDYGFMYDVARKIAEHTGKPLAVACVDDYYIHNRNENSFFGRAVHRAFMRTVRKTMERAGAIFTICDSMQKAYTELFAKPCHVLHTSAVRYEKQETEQIPQIVYIGNLGLNRNEQLAEMGRAIRALNIPGIPGCIHVYSEERDPEILKDLVQENGIVFHGAVSAERVREIMHSSMAVIHTESFDPLIKKITKFSVSTKIADSLMNGPCMIAYGPEGIASIDYLKETGAAYVISNAGELSDGLRRILTDRKLREQIVVRARETAGANHSMEENQKKVRKWLGEICLQTGEDVVQR